jgi:putative transposase
MITGIRLHAYPTDEQKLVLSQWMGCARFIWNAKCDEEYYHRRFAARYYPVGTYAPIDTKTAHFKDPELSPWLSACPSQIIRNAATNWYDTYRNFMKGQCGRPRRKRKTDQGSIYLTRELFSFERCDDGVTRLFICTKRNNIGYLSFKRHRKFKTPNSLYIRKQAGRYTVSFCYESQLKSATPPTLDELKTADVEYLNEHVIGVDRGVAIPVQTELEGYDFTPEQQRKLKKHQRYIKRLQRRLARQQKGSARRNKTKQKLARTHHRIGNIREDFAHKTSRKLVDSEAKVIVFEKLNTRQMTRRPKPKKDENGRFISNRTKQKSGLNRAILNVGWHRIEVFTEYKAKSAGKAVFKVLAHHTSQECAECGHIHPDNRRQQAHFICQRCGHVDNADRNASRVIKKRAITLFSDSGTELQGKGIPLLCKGRGADGKTRDSKENCAHGDEAYKKDKEVSFS